MHVRIDGTGPGTHVFVDGNPITNVISLVLTVDNADHYQRRIVLSLAPDTIEYSGDPTKLATVVLDPREETP